MAGKQLNFFAAVLGRIRHPLASFYILALSREAAR